MQIGTLGIQSAVVPPSAQFGRAIILIDFKTSIDFVSAQLWYEDDGPHLVLLLRN